MPIKVALIVELELFSLNAIALGANQSLSSHKRLSAVDHALISLHQDYFPLNIPDRHVLLRWHSIILAYNLLFCLLQIMLFQVASSSNQHQNNLLKLILYPINLTFQSWFIK